MRKSALLNFKATERLLALSHIKYCLTIVLAQRV